MRIEHRIPTMDLSAARGALGIHENEIKEMIDDGRIAWAWNIATNDSDRRELRILTRCIRDLQAERADEHSEESVIQMVYGKDRPFINGTWFYRSWNCDSGHMINLMLDGSIKRVPGTTWRQGRNGTPCIIWASALAFLKTRRIS